MKSKGTVLTEEARIEELRKLIGDPEAAMRWAAYQLGELRYVSVQENASCAYADFITIRCDNVNLQEDGYCQTCNLHHFKLMFGKRHHYPQGSPQTDPGCQYQYPNDISAGNNTDRDGRPNHPMNIGLMFGGTDFACDVGDNGPAYLDAVDDNGKYIAQNVRERMAKEEKAKLPSRAEKAFATRTRHAQERVAASQFALDRKKRITDLLDMENETDLSRTLTPLLTQGIPKASLPNPSTVIR